MIDRQVVEQVNQFHFLGLLILDDGACTDVQIKYQEQDCNHQECIIQEKRALFKKNDYKSE